VPPAEAILSLGSNQGDRLAWLQQAARELFALPQTRGVALSPVYDTDPVGAPDAFASLPYLNCIVLLETGLTPLDLAAAAHAIESRLGRVRTPGAAGLPRTLDIDLIACGDQRLETPGLTLPHPRAHARRFVLQPLADLRPALRLPGQAQTVTELLRALPATPAVRRLPDVAWPP